jgi:hypothetical protein
MRDYDGRRLYSASDLVNFLGCAREPKIQPHRMEDDRRRKTVPLKAD